MTIRSLVTDSLLTKLQEYGYDAVGYADDLAIIVIGKLGSTASNVLSAVLRVK